MAKGCVRPINLHFCLCFVNSKFIVDWLPKSVKRKEKWQKLTPKEKSTFAREWLWAYSVLWAWFSNFPPTSESNNYGNMIPRFPRSYIDTLFTYMVRIRQYRYIYLFLATIFSTNYLYQEDKGKLIYQTRFCFVAALP